MSEEKILKSEALVDGELDEVAGGTTAETKSDFEFFKRLGKKFFKGSDQAWGDVWFFQRGSEVQDAWSSVGIFCETSNRNYNRYFLNGEEITQDQARIHAIKVLKGQRK